jgi:hypothetical protein
LLGGVIDQDETSSVGQDAIGISGRELLGAHAVAHTPQRVERGEEDIVAFETILRTGPLRAAIVGH